MIGRSQALRRLLERQDGVITRAQAAACGLGDQAVRRRIQRGEWQGLLPGVLLVGGPATAVTWVRAAALWGGSTSVVVGQAAAWWWGLGPSEPGRIDLRIPLHRNLRSRSGVRVIRGSLPAEDITTRRGLRVAGLAFAALFGAVAMGRDGQSVLDRALLRRTTVADVQAVLDRNSGLTGAAQARRWVAAAADGSCAQSERRFIALLRGAGITGWTVNRARRVRGRNRLPDFCFAAQRVIVEIDGWAFHSDPAAFVADRRRQNELMTEGWLVLRYTWSQLMTEPEDVIAELASVLRARSA